MIVPPRFLTKKEQMALKKRVIELGYEGLVKAFLEQGWSQETAKALAETIHDEAVK